MMLDPSEFTVSEFIEMLKDMPQEARLMLDYDGYYDCLLYTSPSPRDS